MGFSRGMKRSGSRRRNSGHGVFARGIFSSGGFNRNGDSGRYSGRGRSLQVEHLEDRRLLAVQPFPVPLDSVDPLGSLIYQSTASATIDSSGEIESFTIDLDAGQSVSVAVDPVAGLDAAIVLRDPSNAIIGTSDFNAAGLDELLQSASVATSGTYTVEVTDSNISTGAFSVDLAVNAAVEAENHDGPPNDTFATAQDLSDSFITLGSGERGALLGALPSSGGTILESDDFESGALDANWAITSSELEGRIQVTDAFGAGGGSFALLMDRDPSGADNLNEATWSVNLTGVTDATLSFSHADFDDEESLLPTTFAGSVNGDGVAISANGVNWHTVLNATNVASGTWQPVTIDLAAEAASAGMTLGPNFKIKFQQFDNFPLATDGRGYDEIVISVPTPPEDWYQFDLADGESASLALSALTAGSVSLELYDSDGTTLLASGISAANVGQVINNFVDQTSDATPNTYYVLVTGAEADYSLIVTRNSDFDTEPNNSPAAAQDITGIGAAWGHVVTQTAAGSALAATLPRGGAATFGAEADPNSQPPREASIPLPFVTGASFEEAQAQWAAAILGANVGGSSVGETSGESPSIPSASLSEIIGPIPILQQFGGPDSTGSIPPDPTVATGPDQVVAVVNTDIAIYDKTTGSELFRQSLNFGAGFFGSTGATSFIFDPWVLYDHESDRFFLVAIDIASNTESNVFLAVSTDSTPTDGNDWHKYKLDFTHDPTGTGLGSDAHFPDYEKLGVNSDAIFISGNYFPIDTGSGVYAGITAIEKAPLLSGGAANIVYEEHFNGFSVFPMQQYGATQTQYFAESLGSSSIRVHAIDSVLGGATRQTFDLTVPAYNQPVNVPQSGGGTAADSISSRIMTGVLRDGSMWFAHAITDPAIGDGETVARWYEVDTNGFADGGGNPILIQSGNVDPGPGVHAWMPAINVDAAGNMGIGFAVGGPNQFYGAGFTGRLESDPAGDTVLPVTEYAFGLANYEALDGSGRNRWGDYTGLALDPSDDSTFWAFNEYASFGNSWDTEIAAFRLQAPNDDDVYGFQVNAGDNITIETFTPADGIFEFENSLDPGVEILDPNGTLVPYSNGIGNELAAFVAGETGYYTVRLFGENETGGEYYFQVNGATGTSSGPVVIDADPDDGQLLASFPLTYTVDFNESLLLTSVDASDLLIGGLPALSVATIDSNTFEFTIDPAANIGDGVYAADMAAGSVTDLQGNGNEVFAGSFVFDSTGPIITSTSWNGSALTGIFPEGSLSFEASFNEDLFQLGSARRGPFAPGGDDVLLVDLLSGNTFSADTVTYDPVTDVFSASYGFLPEGQYRLTLISGDGAFEDQAGNDLDGEPLGAGLDGTPTGNGFVGGNYFVDFAVDRIAPVSVTDPERVAPLGSLIFRSQGNVGLTNSAVDTDDFTVHAQAGESITALVRPDDPNVTLTLRFNSGSILTASAPGEAVVLSNALIAATGLQNLQVGGNGFSPFTLDVLLNASSELEVGDSADGNELAIDSSFLNLGSGRFGLLGTTETATTNSVVWGAQPATGEIIKIDPATGLIINSFAAPGNLLPGNTAIGLSIAEGGSSLIYINSDDDPTTLYRLDPDTGAVLSTETTSGSTFDGLGFESAVESEQLLNGGFESGDFTGWIATNNGIAELTPWTVGGDGGGFFSDSAPLSGAFNAYNGFDGSAGLEYELYQDVAIPVGSTATLTTNHRIQYDGFGISSLSDRNFEITIRNTSDTVLQTLYTENITMNGAPFTDLGWNNQVFDVSAFAGQTIRVHFREFIPEDNTGPSLLQYDDLSLVVSGSSNDLIFLSDTGFDVHRQENFSGLETVAWATGSPIGGLGGDDTGRQFGFFTDGFIHEYDPNTDTDSFFNTIAPPQLDIEGVAFDGTNLYVSTISGDLYTLDPNNGTVLNVVSVPSGSLFGLGANGISAVLPDVDEYEVDLVGIVGESIDVILAGQAGSDFSNELVELLDSNGTVLATADSGPVGVDATNYDLAILGFSVPGDGTYTLRVTSFVGGEYGVVVTEGLAFDSEPNQSLSDPLRSLNPTQGALGFLASSRNLVVEPDNFPSATILDTAVPGVTLSDNIAVGSITSATAGFGAPTGSQVFGSPLFGASGFSEADSEFRADFDTPIAAVSIDVGSDDASDISFLRAFSASGILLAETISGAIASGGSETLSITRPASDIAYIIAAGVGGDISPLDNLRTGSQVASSLNPFNQLGSTGGAYQRTGAAEVEGLNTSKPGQVHSAVSTAYLPVDVSAADLASQLTPRPSRISPKPSSGGGFTSLISVGETEPNDTIATANFVPLGFDVGEDVEVDVNGFLSSVSPTSIFPAEDDGSIPLATATGLVTGTQVIASATIGDGPFGATSGDFDWYEILNVAAGQTISIDIDAVTIGSGLDTVVGLYDSAGILVASNDDSGGLDSFLSFSTAFADDYYVVVSGFGNGFQTDPFDSGSGPGAASTGTYNVTIGLDFVSDIDFFRVALEPGDILGANVNGAATLLSLRGSAGNEFIGSGQDASSIHPTASPLPGGGNAALSWVVDTAGDYYVGVSGGIGTYDLNLRLFRPALENELIGTNQVLFLDFDGESIDTSIFGGSGVASLSSLDTFLPAWGLDPVNDLNAVIDSIIASVEESISLDMRLTGNNGDFDFSGTPGEFDIEILNSRDHADPFGLPNVSRVIVGGTVNELGISTIGIAESIDVGNFETEESAVVLLDLLSADASDPNSLNQYTLDASVSIIDLIGIGVGNITAHEAGHFFANWHTNQFNTPPNIMDQGGNLDNTVGLVGAIWGDGDEIDVDFGKDSFVANEGFTGTENTLNSIAFGLSTGTLDPAIIGPQVVSIDPPAGPIEDFNITNITIEFNEPIAAASANDLANYQLLEAGVNGVFEDGAGDDITVPFAIFFNGTTIVDIVISTGSLGIGKYQLTLEGESSIEDLDGNPLNSTTGPGGGSDTVHEFEVVFPAGGDLYELVLGANEDVIVSTSTPFDDVNGRPLNNLDTELIVYGIDRRPIAFDLDSADGRNAMVDFTSTVPGTYLVQVIGTQGVGEYLIDVQTGVVPILVGDYNENGAVDAADYAVWLDNLGSGTALPNDLTPGVTQSDYDVWRANFGNTLPTAFATGTSVADSVADAEVLEDKTVVSEYRTVVSEVVRSDFTAVPVSNDVSVNASSPELGFVLPQQSESTSAPSFDQALASATLAHVDDNDLLLLAEDHAEGLQRDNAIASTNAERDGDAEIRSLDEDALVVIFTDWP